MAQSLLFRDRRGRNKRNLTRPQQNLSLIAKAALATLFLLFSAPVGLVILYLLKSALGINLFPDFPSDSGTGSRRASDRLRLVAGVKTLR